MRGTKGVACAAERARVRAPAGHEADPSNKWLESNDANNTSWVKFRLTRDSGSGNGNLEMLEESVCTGLACGNTSNR
jgi:hypothetical protein